MVSVLGGGGGGGGGGKILVFHTRSRVVSAMERIRSKNLHTVLLEMSCKISG